MSIYDEYDIITYCDIYKCEDCPRYGDDCDGNGEDEDGKTRLLKKKTSRQN